MVGGIGEELKVGNEAVGPFAGGACGGEATAAAGVGDESVGFTKERR